jgi:hypothetical protein
MVTCKIKGCPFKIKFDFKKGKGKKISDIKVQEIVN